MKNVKPPTVLRIIIIPWAVLAVLTVFMIMLGLGLAQLLLPHDVTLPTPLVLNGLVITLSSQLTFYVGQYAGQKSMYVLLAKEREPAP